MSDSNYRSYLRWKNWQQPDQLPNWKARYFQAELRKSCPLDAQTVLEIGFGNADFLEWASKSYKVTGLEIIEELVERAKQRGYDAYLFQIPPLAGAPSPIEGRRFDLIAGFDVAEHISQQNLPECFTFFKNHLTPNGRVILRFPNGESPFSLPLQNGDATHLTYLNKSKIEQLCIGTGLRLVEYRNSARVFGKTLNIVPKYFAFLLRDIAELLIGHIYFYRRLPLDPTAIAVLSHDSAR
jgi:cyclopropane fatty-acyl-phospholipid synthase-like methyltransferase